MFNPLKKSGPDMKITVNRLNALKHADEETIKETKTSSQPNKSGAAFSKALNAVRKEVEDTQSPSSPIVNKSSKSASFGEAINARREKTINPFLKVSPQFQPKPAAEAETE